MKVSLWMRRRFLKAGCLTHMMASMWIALPEVIQTPSAKPNLKNKLDVHPDLAERPL